MSPRNIIAFVSVTALLGGCSLLRPGNGTPQVSAGYRPAAKSTVWPAPGGNLTTCGPSGPGGDAPTPRPPTTDSLKVKNQHLRQVVAGLCSFSVPVPKDNSGSEPSPLE